MMQTFNYLTDGEASSWESTIPAPPGPWTVTSPIKAATESVGGISTIGVNDANLPLINGGWSVEAKLKSRVYKAFPPINAPAESVGCMTPLVFTIYNIMGTSHYKTLEELERRS